MGKVFELTLTYIVLFVMSPWINFGQRPQVDHNLYRTVTMYKVAIASAASKDAVKRLIYDLDRSQNVLSEARTKINKVFNDLREEQDSLAIENGVLDVDGSEILDINAGGGCHDCDQGYPDPDQGDHAGGSVQREVGQAPSEGR